MEPTGRRKAPPDDRLRAIRESQGEVTPAPDFASLHPGYKCARRFYLLPGSEIIRLATSLFQMNSTSSAPMVAVMKPAP